MQSSRAMRGLAVSSLWAALIVLGGCTSASQIELRDRQISELTFERGRMQASIQEMLTERDRLNQQIETLETEKSASIQNAEELESRLRLANQQLETLTSDHGHLQTNFDDISARNAMLERSLDKVKSVASESVTELSDLRLASRRHGEQLENFRKENSALREDRKKLLEKVTRLEDESNRANAVVRSLRADGSSGNDRAIELTARVEKLEKENADLRGEKLAIQKQLDNTSAREDQLAVTISRMKSQAGTDQGRQADSSALIYEKDLRGLSNEVVGFASAKYRKALTGDIAWDVFDKSIAGVAGVLFLFLVWHMMRSRRMRKLRREANDLREELEELEEQNTLLEQQRQSERHAAARAQSPRRGASSAAVRRRSGFSAVISTAAAGAAADEAVEDAEPEPTVMMDAVRAPQSVSVSAPVSAAPPPTPAAVEDDLASTQIISSLTQEELAAEQLVDPEAAGGRPAGGDKELLAELKAVINKKFDEIVD